MSRSATGPRSTSAVGPGGDLAGASFDQLDGEDRAAPVAAVGPRRPVEDPVGRERAESDGELVDHGPRRHQHVGEGKSPKVVTAGLSSGSMPAPVRALR